ILLLEHDLFRKPVPTFRDHALVRALPSRSCPTGKGLAVGCIGRRAGPRPAAPKFGDGDHADAAMLEVNAPAKPEAAVVAALGRRAIVLIGMMGAGKSAVGRRLCTRLGAKFVGCATEIEAAAGAGLGDIFR